MNHPTKRQREVLTFIRAYLSARQRLPTTREIQEYFGWASQTAAVHVIRALEAKGKINRDRSGRWKLAGVRVELVDCSPER